MDYLRQQKISIHRLALEHADIYAYKNKDGIANWDITVPDTVQSTSSPAGDAMNISEARHPANFHPARHGNHGRP